MIRFTFRPLLFCVATCMGLPSAIVRGEEAWVPGERSRSHYRETFSRNPFMSPSEEGVKASFSDHLSLSAVSTIGDKVSLLVLDRKTRRYQTISRDENQFGFRLVHLALDDDRRKTRAVIARGDETGTIRFIEGQTGKGEAVPVVGFSPKEPPKSEAPKQEEKVRRLKLRLPRQVEKDSEIERETPETEGPSA